PQMLRSWPEQTRAQSGLSQPQDSTTLPHSSEPASLPSALAPHPGPKLVPKGSMSWALAAGWRLIEAPKLLATGAEISRPAFNSAAWYEAVVPGTVLTTLVERGVYPEPEYGLNNLAIPESLSRQDYWYRIVFEPPAAARGRRAALNFH